MPTSNPALSEKAFERVAQPAATQVGWGAGSVPPSGDVASPWTPTAATEVMTVNGAVTATGVLLVLLVATSAVSWMATDVLPDGTGVEIPAMAWGGLIGGLVFAIATIVKPAWARITAPLYALSEGLFIGAISKAYDTQYDGIVVNAIASTVGVLALMLFLHVTRIIKVTDRFRTVVMCATGAIALVYVLNLVLRIFGTELPFIHESGPVGIGISVVIVVVAALNLSLDFDFIEKATAARAPKTTEWYAAFGLLLTLVWLYLELLRLLSKLQSRN